MTAPTSPASRPGRSRAAWVVQLHREGPERRGCRRRCRDHHERGQHGGAHAAALQPGHRRRDHPRDGGIVPGRYPSEQRRDERSHGHDGSRQDGLLHRDAHDPQRHRGQQARRDRQHDRRRCASRRRLRGPGHSGQRLGLGRDPRDRRADGEGGAAKPRALHLVQRRGIGADRLEPLRRAAAAGRTRRHRGDAELRHDRVFNSCFSSRGLASEPTPFDGHSDYRAFILAGIPAGGLFTGAEQFKTAAQVALYGEQADVASDPCYHKACDTIANVNNTALGPHVRCGGRGDGSRSRRARRRSTASRARATSSPSPSPGLSRQTADGASGGAAFAPLLPAVWRQRG